MLITKRLKKHLRANHGLAKGATDDVVQKLVGEKLASGGLTMEQFGELTSAKADDPILKLVDKAVAKRLERSTLTPHGLFGAGSDIRVKNVSERFSTKRYAAKHSKFGHEVLHPDTRQPVETQSELQQAKMGAYFKWMARKTWPDLEMADHEMGLLMECVQHDPWAVHTLDNDQYAVGKDVTPERVKTLLSDAISGGQYVNPLWFDQNIIEFPLLYGELFPYVDVVEMPRSNQINTAQLANVSVTWGNPEGTSITEFNTASLLGPIAAFVQNVTFAAEVGRDEMADSVVNIGMYLTRRVGERLVNELDRVVASGNGTTEPLGIFNTGASATLINADISAVGPPTIGDYEGLLFAIPKERRQMNWNIAFIGNDISYRRARAIPRGPGDEQRVLGMTHQDYSILNVPYRVQQNIANNLIACAALKRYRMWRRLGMEMRWSVEGKNLMLNNTALMTLRGRYYGQVIDGAAVSYMTDAQS